MKNWFGNLYGKYSQHVMCDSATEMNRDRDRDRKRMAKLQIDRERKRESGNDSNASA